MTNPPEGNPQKKSKFFEFIDALSKIHLVKVDVHVDKIELGDKTYNIENGFVILGEDVKLKISRDEKGNVSFIKDGANISTTKESKKENVHLLDTEKKAFSRADISEIQIGYMSIEKQHESLIKKMKPFLDGYRNNIDIASLLIASTIIRFEDGEQKNEYLISTYFKNLDFYKDVGRMVYNLFRSGILEGEIIPLIDKLTSIYDFNTARQNFLTQWHDIIGGGYPTAYFVQFWDDENKIFSELNWRFNRKVSFVDVFSRGNVRNKRNRNHCLNYCKKHKGFEVEIGKPYKLGLTPALKVKVVKKG